MPANIPPMKHKVPMPKAKDGLEKYYNYDVEDESKVKKQLKYQRNEKIAMGFAITMVVSLMLGIVCATITFALNSKPMAITSLGLFMIMFASGLIGSAFDNNNYY